MNIPPFLQHFTENARRIYTGGSTIGECLLALVGRYPRLKARLFQAEGKLSLDLNLYLNGVHVNSGDLSHPVKEGDQLYISHVIVGG